MNVFKAAILRLRIVIIDALNIFAACFFRSKYIVDIRACNRLEDRKR